VILLYDNPRSSNALKVRFLLAELGLAYERHEVPLARPRPGWYLEVNPVGGVPALRDGDLVMAESNAILRYLANREGRGDLYPRDPPGRARVDEFLDRFALTLRPALFRVEAPALGFGGAAPDPAEAARQAAAIADVLALFDGLVTDEGSALGGFTLADVAAAPVLFRTARTGLDLGRYPRLLRWRETVTARPAFARAGPVQ
jgi:glutathione S-transferase